MTESSPSASSPPDSGHSGVSSARRGRLAVVAALAVPAVLLGAVAARGLDRPEGATAPSAAGVQFSAETGSGIAAGDQAPSFEVTTLDGGPFAFPAGAPTILTFVNLCPTCVADAAKVAAVQSRFPGVQVLAVASDPTADATALRSFIDEAGATDFEMALDPQSTLTQRFDAFAIGGIVVADADGRITYRGPVDEAQIAGALQAAGARV